MERRKFGRAVIIGLGGTGQHALIRIKKMFIQNCGAVPPCIRLVVFDTDGSRVDLALPDGRTVEWSPQEFCHLEVASIGAAIRKPEVEEWWMPYSPINKLAVNAGTGCVREVGRLALFANINVVRRRLQRAFNEILEFGTRQHMRAAGLGLLDLAPQVFVVGSLAGGTGSGTFFDISILCRALGGQGWFYTGVFVLPWVFQGIARTPNENAYAALLELERLNECSPANPYTVRYGSGAQWTFTLEEEPFHVVNLVDGICDNQARILAPDQLADFIGECLFHTVGAIGERARSVKDNIMVLKLAVPPDAWRDRRAAYATFGVSSIVYPHLEIHQRASLDLAIELVQEIIDRQGAEPPSPAPGAANPAITQLITQAHLEPGQIVPQLIPPAKVGAYELTEEFASTPSQAQATLRANVEQWQIRRLDQIAKSIQANAQTLAGEVKQALLTFLDGMRQKEAHQQLPPDSVRAACLELLAQLHALKAAVQQDRDKTLESIADLGAHAGAALKAIGEARGLWFHVAKIIRAKAAAYVQLMNDLLRRRAENAAREQALSLFDGWIHVLEGSQHEAESRTADRKQAIQQLQALQASLAAERHTLRSARLRERKSLFEVYVGDQDEQGRDLTWYHTGRKPPTAATEYPAFWKATGLASIDELARLQPPQLRQLILGHAQACCAPLKEVSVLDVLRTLHKEDPAEVKEIVETALENATLLLPLDHSEHAGRDQHLAQFTVIGSSPLAGDGADRAFLSQFIPAHQTAGNLWAETGDIHRIYLCVHFAVFPLYNLTHLARIRDIYLERVLPPTHTDYHFAFHLPDPFPEEPNRGHALKLLTLAMLDPVGLIHHERLHPGKSQFVLDAAIRARHPEIEEEDLVLPGNGKFYLLLPAVVRTPGLLALLEESLRERALDPAVNEAFLAAVREQKQRFTLRLANARRGLRKPEASSFTHMISGNLYQEQVDFLHAVLKSDRLLRSPQPLKDLLDSLKGT